MSCECVTCYVYWMKVNEIHVSFGEVLCWECVTWHIMMRGGSCFYSALDMWSWAVCFLKMSFRQQWCDICVFQTAFLCIVEFLRYDASWVLFRMARFYRSMICPTLLLACECTECTTCREDAVLFFPSKRILEECVKLKYICYIWQLPAFMALNKYSHLCGLFLL
jgi:hypothetical protein